MTMTSVQPYMLPNPYDLATLLQATVSYQAFLMDASAEKVAVVFRAPKAGTLARIGFRTGTVTTGDTLKVSFQDVSTADGNPDGTPDQFRTQAVGDGDDNVWFRSGLVTSDGTNGGTLRTVVRGELVAAVIEFDSFVAGNLNIASTALLASDTLGGSYLTHFTAAWAKSRAVSAAVAVEYDDGSFGYIPNTLPAVTKTSTNFNSGSTPDEVALKFSHPVPLRVNGFWFASAVSGDFDVILYDSDGTTALATFTGDKDVSTPSTAAALFAAPFSASVSLLANTFYRIALRPSTVTNCSRIDFTVNAAAVLDQMSGGQNFHYSERTNAGAWTDTTTKRPLLGVIVDGQDDGATVSGGTSRASVVNAGGL